VLLCEKNDLASATSSSSSKLIHGGLRYLENYEFRLVREALSERDVLLRNAGHIVHPLRFILPHNKHLRPAWMIRVGMFLYDNLARRSARLPGSRRMALRSAPQGTPLKPDIVTGFEYSDARVDDSRLVVLNAIDARQRGATILTRTSCVALEHADGHWIATLQTPSGAHVRARARTLVNAAGPWVEALQRLAMPSAPGQAAGSKLRLIKGSHFTVPRLYEGDWAYILQNPDGRIVFVIPYQDRYSLIGTTDVLFEGDPGKVAISQEEIDYLCETVNSYFTQQISGKDITWSYSGVRPLYDDHAGNASAVTRDYVFDVSGGWPNMRWKSSRPSPASPSPGRRVRPCLAETCRRQIRLLTNASSNHGIRGSHTPWHTAIFIVMAHWPSKSWAVPPPLPTWARSLVQACSSAKCAGWSITNGP